MRDEKAPVYLRTWFMVLLFIIGFFGVLITPFSILLWPADIVLVIWRIIWELQKRKQPAQSAQTEITAVTQMTAAPQMRGLGDLFKANENASLIRQINELTQKLSSQNELIESLNQQISEADDKIQRIMLPEQRDLQFLTEEIKLKQNELNDLCVRKENDIKALTEQKQHEIDRMQLQINELNYSISNAETKLSSLEAQIIVTDETVLLQSFGLYEPKYDFATSTLFKDRLDEIRKQQKQMLKDRTAATGSDDWSINGNASQGKRMVRDMQKLLLRAFNTECDELISKVKFNNIESAEKRIRASRDAISRLGTVMGISITSVYLDLKIKELYLAYEFAVKKQEEKEELKRLRADAREQAKLEREIEAERRKLEKEQAHCQNALAKMLQQDISSMNEEEKAAFEVKKAELEAQIGEIEKGIVDVDYRAANQRAGYVYVISNIGSFGEDVYKIGMTRRLDPMDRVDELGDASVPFNFDVHAMIFSEDAPALEAALHKAFEDRKVNMINTRREFFHVTLEEIRQVIKDNFDKTVEFTEVAPAEQYRESKLMHEQLQAHA